MKKLIRISAAIFCLILSLASVPVPGPPLGLTFFAMSLILLSPDFEFINNFFNAIVKRYPSFGFKLEKLRHSVLKRFDYSV